MPWLREWMRLAGWGPEHPVLHVVALAVMGVAVLTFFTMAYVLVYAARARHARRLRLAFDRAWRPRMALASVESGTVNARRPRTARGRLWWLMQWNRMQRPLRGQSRENLNRLMRNLGMDRHAGKVLRSFRVRRRLVALESLRHLGDDAWWSKVAPLCRHPNPYIALAAARALLAMSPSRGLAYALDIGLARDDWSPRLMADLCQTAGVEVCTPVLIDAWDKCRPHTARKIAALVAFAEPRAFRLWAHAQLADGTDPVIAIAALNLLGELADPRDHARIAGFLQHGDATIRLAALRALRRQVRPDDISHYLVALTDRNFLVRLEAAEAAVAVTGPDPGRARDVLARIEDPYGRDQLLRAYGEAGLDVPGATP